MKEFESKEPLEPRRTLFDGSPLPPNWEHLSPEELTGIFTQYELCDITFVQQVEPIGHFLHRAEERGLTAEEAIVAIIDVDDPNGNVIANILMPGENWQQCRDQGHRPIARGLVQRDSMQYFLDDINESAATKLRDAQTDGPPIVIIDYGVVEVYNPCILQSDIPDELPPLPPDLH